MHKPLTILLIYEIKKKPQIEHLENSFIEERLEQYFLTNGKERKQLEEEFEKKQDKIIKSKIFKKVVKEIREEIGHIYGQFLTQKFKKKEKILLKNDLNEFLLLHKSTRERINYYDEIYSKIFSWYKPKHIVDLCCGMNPLSYPIMKIKPKYLAIDLNPRDMEFLNSFFMKNKIKGEAIPCDVSSLEFLKDKKINEADLVFLFKAIDSLETLKKNISKTLLENLPQKKIVVSFPTKSLIAKKKIKEQDRNWFLNYLKKKEWEYEQLNIENEIFFLITK